MSEASIGEFGVKWKVLLAEEIGSGLVAWLSVTPSAKALRTPGERQTDESYRLEETGVVAFLDAINTSKFPILFPADLVFGGGLQTRAVERSAILAPLTRARLAVRCVEQGRWAGAKVGAGLRPIQSMSGRARRAIAAVRAETLARRGAYEADQRSVWREVEQELSAACVESDTRSYRAYLDGARQAHMRSACTAIHPPRGANGVLVLAQSGAWLEVFPSGPALRRSAAAIVADLFEEGTTTTTRPAANRTPLAEAYLTRVWRAPLRSLGTAEGTAGRSFAVSTEKFRGSILMLDDELAHLAVGGDGSISMKNDEQEDKAMTDTTAFASIERRRGGALVGLAVGDALGAAVEFARPGTFAPVSDFRGGGPHGLEPGEWTDDTSMALALADSLAQHEMNLVDQARRYVAWWRKGEYSVTGRCFDIGNTVRASLDRFERLGHGASGDTSDGASGNGSIMRLAPVAIRYAGLFPSNVRRLSEYGAQSSATTHRSEKCLSACRYLTVVLAALMNGCDRDEVLAANWPVLDELHAIAPLHPAIDEVARGSFRRKQPPVIRGSGYVVESLEAALWAFHNAGTFSDAVLAAVNLGNDADTTGAVCGQLAGAYFGIDGIPPRWVQGLAKREWLDDAVRRLCSPPGEL